LHEIIIIIAAKYPFLLRSVIFAQQPRIDTKLFVSSAKFQGSLGISIEPESDIVILIYKSLFLKTFLSFPHCFSVFSCWSNLAVKNSAFTFLESEDAGLRVWGFSLNL